MYKVGKQRLLQLQELEQLRHDKCKNVEIYKEKTKGLSPQTHQKKKKIFQVNDKV